MGKKKEKKEITIFNLSFMDLLSGALGGVIILLITIASLPFFDSERVDLINERIDVEMKALQQLKDYYGTLIYNVRNVERFGLDMARITEIAGAIGSMVDQLEEHINHLDLTYKRLQVVQKNTLEEIETVEEEIKVLEEKVDEINRTLLKRSYIYITISWDTNDDVDLWVVNPEGKVFSYKQIIHEGDSGILSPDAKDDSRKRGFEAWYTKKKGETSDDLVPLKDGTYKVYANLYAKRSSEETESGEPVPVNVKSIVQVNSGKMIQDGKRTISLTDSNSEDDMERMNHMWNIIISGSLVQIKKM